jgi:hypothetical protein
MMFGGKKAKLACAPGVQPRRVGMRAQGRGEHERFNVQGCLEMIGVHSTPYDVRDSVRMTGGEEKIFCKRV